MLRIGMALTAVVCLLLPSMALSSQTERQIDRILREYKTRSGGASVLVIKNGQKYYQKSFGMADRRNGTKNTSDTNFRLASVSKTITSLATLILVHEGKLTLDTKIRKIFPELPSYTSKITVKQLLNHTSGLRPYTQYASRYRGQLKDEDVLNMLVKHSRSLMFRPGTSYKYSNTGYAMLANIITKVSGMHYSEFLKTKIFDPLGMKSAVAGKSGANIAKRAYGNAHPRSDQNKYSRILGDGGVYMSTNDIFKLDQGIYKDKLIPASLMRIAYQRTRLRNYSVNYGLGWRLSALSGQRMIYHTGSSIGFKTIYARFPSRGLSIVILANKRPSKPKQLALKIARLLL